ncbi:adenine deaminase [Candidatus Zixiibacteriota bacterium]
MDLERMIAVARGREEPDLVLKNARVVNVFSGEIYKSDVAISQGRIAGLGNYRGGQAMDLRGKYLCPGFIDGHVHIESSMVGVSEFARTVVPQGTTTVIIDPHEIANVLGSDGILFMLKSSKYNPLNVFMMLPSCVPSTNLETAGSELKALDLFPFLSDKWVLGLGEVMNYPAVLTGDDDVMDKIKIVSGKRIDGHAPGVSGKDLAAYVVAGIQSDHESTTLEEAQEKLRLGMWVMLREGSTTKNLRDLLPLVTRENVHRMFFVTDDRHPRDLLAEGHINYMVKVAIQSGLDPALVIRMATLNTAQYFQLEKLGAIAPGYSADLVVMNDFKSCRVSKVFKSGELVAENGKPLYDPPSHGKIFIRSSINTHWLKEEDFQIQAQDGPANVIGLIPSQIITKHLRLKPKVKDGLVGPDIKRDLLKLAIVERHEASGNVGLGLVRGFGLKKGALASSVAHDSHNLIILGTNDRDMMEAAIQVIRMKGGLAVAADGQVVDSLPLPVAGLMSDGSVTEVKAKLDELHKAARHLGCKIHDPLSALAFLSLPVVPALKLTDRGLVDVEKFKLIGLFEG